MSTLDKVIYILMLAFPVLIITIQPLGSVIYISLSIIGIYIAVVNKVSPLEVSQLKIFSWIALGHFLIMLISIALSNEPTSDFINLGRKLQFLFAPFVALVAWRSELKFIHLIGATKIGSVLIGLIVFGEYFYSNGGVGRLSGMFNANIFGDIAVFLTLFSIIMIAKEEEKEFVRTSVAFMLGVSAVVFSGSRGAMLIFIILFFIYIIFSYSSIQKRVSRYAIIVFLGVFTFYAVYNISNFQNRIDRLDRDIKMWQSKERVSTSNGLRLEMWDKGLRAYLDAPWFGYGYRNSNYVVSRYVEDGHAKRHIVGYSHLHNTYLTHMVNAGFFGLLSILLLFGIPLYYFLKSLRLPEVHEIAVTGSLLIFGYMIMGLFHSCINEEYKNSFLLLFLSILLPMVLTKGKDIKS